MPWWAIVSLILAVCGVALFVISHLVFRIACVPRKKQKDDEDAYFKKLIRHADEESRHMLLEALETYRAAPGEPVSIRSEDGLWLKGHYLPADIPTDRVLLLCHGWNSSPGYDFSAAIPYLHGLGWNLLAIDQRAQGESEGRYITFGALEHRDVCLWAKYLVERLGPQSQIVLHGLSMGATAVLLTLKERLPEQVKGVIADCGFDSAIREFLYLGRRSHLPASLILPFADKWAQRLGHFSFYDTDTTLALTQADRPVLFIHGTADTFVPSICTQRNAESCLSPHTVILVDGAEHGSSYLCDTVRCQNAIRSFLDEVAPPKHSENMSAIADAG